jgi:enoyl-CoA hydratase
MIFSAKMIPAQKAKEIGLVNEVYPIEELLTKTKELANTIAHNSPMAISKAINAVNLSDTEKGFETEIKYFGVFSKWMIRKKE